MQDALTTFSVRAGYNVTVGVRRHGTSGELTSFSGSSDSLLLGGVTAAVTGTAAQADGADVTRRCVL